MQSRASPYGYLLNRVTDYATAVAAAPNPSPTPAKKDVSGGGKIINEFTGKGVISRLCKLLVSSLTSYLKKVCLRS